MQETHSDIQRNKTCPPNGFMEGHVFLILIQTRREDPEILSELFSQRFCLRDSVCLINIADRQHAGNQDFSCHGPFV